MRTPFLLALLLAAPALADTTASPARVTASPEDGVHLESEDGRFGMKVGLLATARATATLTSGGGTFSGLLLPNVRPQLRAHLLEPWLRLMMQADLTSEVARLTDMEVEAQPWDELGFKVGQFVTPFSRAFLTPAPKLQFQGFTVANTEFRADRDIGVMVFGSPAGGRLEYALGVFNGSGIAEPATGHAHLMTVGRVAGTVFGRPPPTQGHQHYDESAGLAALPPTLQVGASGAVRRTELHDQWTFGVDASYASGGLFAQAEAYLRTHAGSGEGGQAGGLDLQAGCYLRPQTLELAGRLSHVRYGLSSPSANLTQGELLLAHNVNAYHLRAGARYTATYAGTAVAGYGAGLTHAFSLQAQLWF